eukprot:2518644-Alexandrium_andersonii.AAC.1
MASLLSYYPCEVPESFRLPGGGGAGGDGAGGVQSSVLGGSVSVHGSAGSVHRLPAPPWPSQPG